MLVFRRDHNSLGLVHEFLDTIHSIWLLGCERIEYAQVNATHVSFQRVIVGDLNWWDHVIETAPYHGGQGVAKHLNNSWCVQIEQWLLVFLRRHESLTQLVGRNEITL